MPSSGRLPRAKTAVFSCLIVVSFFALAEAVLWVAGVRTLLAERDPFEGFSRLVRVFVEDPARGVLATPPRAVQRSFNYQEFRAVKPADGFRFFVLGGSSAAGFPWGAEIAFTKVLGEALKSSWPERTIEAVNAAAMSYGSHRLRILAHEVIDYSPDVLVVYEGHNEFVERRFYKDFLERSPRLDRLRALMYRSRLYSLLVRAAQRIRAAAKPPVQEIAASTTGGLLGLDVTREEAAGVTEEDKTRARDLFEENLRAIVELGSSRRVPVVLCTVASNLRDWPPNQSSFETALGEEARRRAAAFLDQGKALLQGGDPAGAAASLESARSIAPEYAEIQFALGRAYEALSRWDDARAAYIAARDADAQPARASSSLNAVIRRVAADTGAILVDIERLFEHEAPHGLVGFNLIEDYVHPTPQGHRLIALELWKDVNEHGLPGAARAADASEFWRVVGQAPSGDVAAATGLAGASAEERGKAAIYLYNQGVVLEQQSLIEPAIEKYRACLELEPRYFAAVFNLGRLFHIQGHPDLAAEQFRKALEAEPGHVKSMLGLGMALVRMGHPDQAEAVLARATRVDPGLAGAWNGLGHTMVLQGRTSEAIAVFRKAVTLEPGDPDARINLGLALLQMGQGEEAATHLRAGLTARPGDQRARAGLAALAGRRRSP